MATELANLFKDGKFVGQYEDYGRVIEALQAAADNEVRMSRSGEADFMMFTSRGGYTDRVSRERRRTRLNSLNRVATRLGEYIPQPLPDSL